MKQVAIEKFQRLEAGQRKIKIAYSPGTSLWIFEKGQDYMILKNVNRSSICEAQ